MAKHKPRSSALDAGAAATAQDRPPSFKNVLVLTSRYFSLAYCDEKGIWRNPATGKELTGVQGWRPA